MQIEGHLDRKRNLRRCPPALQPPEEVALQSGGHEGTPWIFLVDIHESFLGCAILRRPSGVDGPILSLPRYTSVASCWTIQNNTLKGRFPLSPRPTLPITSMFIDFLFILSLSVNFSEARSQFLLKCKVPVRRRWANISANGPGNVEWVPFFWI